METSNNFTIIENFPSQQRCIHGQKDSCLTQLICNSIQNLGWFKFSQTTSKFQDNQNNNKHILESDRKIRFGTNIQPSFVISNKQQPRLQQLHASSGQNNLTCPFLVNQDNSNSKIINVNMSSGTFNCPHGYHCNEGKISIFTTADNNLHSNSTDSLELHFAADVDRNYIMETQYTLTENFNENPQNDAKSLKDSSILPSSFNSSAKSERSYCAAHNNFEYDSMDAIHASGNNMSHDANDMKVPELMHIDKADFTFLQTGVRTNENQSQCIHMQSLDTHLQTYCSDNCNSLSTLDNGKVSFLTNCNLNDCGFEQNLTEATELHSFTDSSAAPFVAAHSLDTFNLKAELCQSSFSSPVTSQNELKSPPKESLELHFQPPLNPCHVTSVNSGTEDVSQQTRSASFSVASSYSSTPVLEMSYLNPYQDSKHQDPFTESNSSSIDLVNSKIYSTNLTRSLAGLSQDIQPHQDSNLHSMLYQQSRNTQPLSSHTGHYQQDAVTGSDCVSNAKVVGSSVQNLDNYQKYTDCGMNTVAPFSQTAVAHVSNQQQIPGPLEVNFQPAPLEALKADLQPAPSSSHYGTSSSTLGNQYSNFTFATSQMAPVNTVFNSQNTIACTSLDSSKQTQSSIYSNSSSSDVTMRELPIDGQFNSGYPLELQSVQNNCTAEHNASMNLQSSGNVTSASTFSEESNIIVDNNGQLTIDQQKKSVKDLTPSISNSSVTCLASEICDYTKVCQFQSASLELPSTSQEGQKPLTSQITSESYPQPMQVQDSVEDKKLGFEASHLTFDPSLSNFHSGSSLFHSSSGLSVSRSNCHLIHPHISSDLSHSTFDLLLSHNTSSLPLFSSSSDLSLSHSSSGLAFSHCSSAGHENSESSTERLMDTSFGFGEVLESHSRNISFEEIHKSIVEAGDRLSHKIQSTNLDQNILDESCQLLSDSVETPGGVLHKSSFRNLGTLHTEKLEIVEADGRKIASEDTRLASVMSSLKSLPVHASENVPLSSTFSNNVKAANILSNNTSTSNMLDSSISAPNILSNSTSAPTMLAKSTPTPTKLVNSTSALTMLANDTSFPYILANSTSAPAMLANSTSASSNLTNSVSDPHISANSTSEASASLSHLNTHHNLITGILSNTNLSNAAPHQLDLQDPVAGQPTATALHLLESSSPMFTNITSSRNHSNGMPSTYLEAGYQQIHSAVTVVSSIPSSSAAPVTSKNAFHKVAVVTCDTAKDLLQSTSLVNQFRSDLLDEVSRNVNSTQHSQGDQVVSMKLTNNSVSGISSDMSSLLSSELTSSATLNLPSTVATVVLEADSSQESKGGLTEMASCGIASGICSGRGHSNLDVNSSNIQPQIVMSLDDLQKLLLQHKLPHSSSQIRHQLSESPVSSPQTFILQKHATNFLRHSKPRLMTRGSTLSSSSHAVSPYQQTLYGRDSSQLLSEKAQQSEFIFTKETTAEGNPVHAFALADHESLLKCNDGNMFEISQVSQKDPHQTQPEPMEQESQSEIKFQEKQAYNYQQEQQKAINSFFNEIPKPSDVNLSPLQFVNQRHMVHSRGQEYVNIIQKNIQTETLPNHAEIVQKNIQTESLPQQDIHNVIQFDPKQEEINKLLKAKMEQDGQQMMLFDMQLKQLQSVKEAESVEGSSADGVKNKCQYLHRLLTAETPCQASNLQEIETSLLFNKPSSQHSQSNMKPSDTLSIDTNNVVSSASTHASVKQTSAVPFSLGLPSSCSLSQFADVNLGQQNSPLMLLNFMRNVTSTSEKMDTKDSETNKSDIAYSGLVQLPGEQKAEEYHTTKNESSAEMDNSLNRKSLLAQMLSEGKRCHIPLNIGLNSSSSSNSAAESPFPSPTFDDGNTQLTLIERSANLQIKSDYMHVADHDDGGDDDNENAIFDVNIFHKRPSAEDFHFSREKSGNVPMKIAKPSIDADAHSSINTPTSPQPKFDFGGAVSSASSFSFAFGSKDHSNLDMFTFGVSDAVTAVRDSQQYKDGSNPNSCSKPIAQTVGVRSVAIPTQPVRPTSRRPKEYMLKAYHPSKVGSMELRILSQPELQHRARYQTEGSRGAIKDESLQGYPLIKLFGYNKATKIQVYIGDESARVKPHGFYQACRVSGKSTTPCTEQEIEGTAILELDMLPENDMTVKLDCIGILKLRNADVERRIGSKRAKDKKKMNTRACLVIRCHIEKSNGRQCFLQVASNPIICTQPVGQPEISRMSLSESPVQGGDSLFIIGKNFRNRKTSVLFQTLDTTDDYITWQAEAQIEQDFFQPTHIICKIPPYKKQTIHRVQEVQIVVSCAGKMSDPHSFLYIPAHPVISPVKQEVLLEISENRPEKQLPFVAPEALRLNRMVQQSYAKSSTSQSLFRLPTHTSPDTAAIEPSPAPSPFKGLRPSVLTNLTPAVGSTAESSVKSPALPPTSVLPVTSILPVPIPSASILPMSSISAAVLSPTSSSVSILPVGLPSESVLPVGPASTSTLPVTSTSVPLTHVSPNNNVTNTVSHQIQPGCVFGKRHNETKENFSGHERPNSEFGPSISTVNTIVHSNQSTVMSPPVQASSCSSSQPKLPHVPANIAQPSPHTDVPSAVATSPAPFFLFVDPAAFDCSTQGSKIQQLLLQILEAQSKLCLAGHVSKIGGKEFTSWCAHSFQFFCCLVRLYLGLRVPGQNAPVRVMKDAMFSHIQNTWLRKTLSSSTVIMPV